jgi:hypothetical protein
VGWLRRLTPVGRAAFSRRHARSNARSDEHEAALNTYYAAFVGASDEAIIGKTLKGIFTSWNSGSE